MLKGLLTFLDALGEVVAVARERGQAEARQVGEFHKGVKIGEDKKQRTREAQVWELKYKDEAGKPQKMYPVEKPVTPAPPPAEKGGATPGAAPAVPKGPAVPSPIPGAAPAPK